MNFIGMLWSGCNLYYISCQQTVDVTSASLSWYAEEMPFYPATFEAEVALGMIPTERLPAIAQEAIEAGFDGPNILRMAVMEPVAGWAIDQVLPRMLEDLGCQSKSVTDAALYLAEVRAQRILETREDPLSSISYFYRLMQAADYPPELYELGYFDDDEFFSDDPEEKRAAALEAVEEFLSPTLRQQRFAERKAAWDLEQARIRSEWPYVLNSPTGRALLKERYVEKINEMRPFLWIQLVAWIFCGWGIGSWHAAIIGYIVSIPILLILPIPAQYLSIKRERRDTLLRRGVPDDEI
jgi:hypothetical protein